ncbi:RHS repeat-associated core domain-containing protein [Dyella sp. M7H15-1]|uniref:RHS repeat-associated core domain-containing protein n=1 Tax=Dyella sp. M7H15-1 TaxID=2501295 RepID=UPI001F0C2200|nr:RHS repeat-associated core domain-containing protein [Dyella sp. M7H15-1]
MHFPGQYYDAETGLSDNVHRTFDGSIGDYTQVDPIGYAGGQWSLYAYVGGNPLRYKDPFGLQQYDPVEERDEEVEPWAYKLGPNQTSQPLETEAQREAREGICRRNSLPTNGSQLGHIFNANNEGHLPNTPENQQLIEDVANNPDNELGTDSRGLTWYAETQPDGSQVWVSTMNGVIQNGGLNQAPRNYNTQTGLSSPTRPNQ